MKLPKISLTKKPTYIKFGEDLDFFNVFRNIEHEFKTCFILESLGEYSDQSRYSLIGFSPRHIISGHNNILSFDDQDFSVENPYQALRDIIPQDIISRNYAGGLVGYIGYDAMSYFEPTMKIKTDPKYKRFVFGVFTDGIVFDKLTGEYFYFFYEQNRLNTIQQIINKKTEDIVVHVKYKQDSLTETEHADIVQKVKEQILSGNTFQCQIGLKSTYEITGDTTQIYEKLRSINPSPYMYYVKFENQKIIGASPELLFRMRNGVMETFPLAGTIQRGKDNLEDQQLARTLLHDPKEIAEHNMLVDLHRNDMGRVAEFGSVKVRSLMDIKKFSHVQHISSEITGTLKQGEDMFSALASNFPAGTLSGAPKIESMKIIDTFEKHARGPYGGALGHFGFNGDCTFAIPIRTLFISGTEGFTQASGGIVYDSVAKNEYDELQRKLRAIKAVLELFEK